jgi:uncharacterized membrane protein YuzA (DUF378 family)
MDFKKLTQPDSLEKWSFLWSIVRMCSGTVSFLLGGFPFLQWLLPAGSPFVLFRIVGGFITLTWIISGVVTGYLLYRWFTAGKMLFGQKNRLDLVAFAVLIVSGINTGLAGLISWNIGLSILRFYPMLVVAALIDISAAGYLLWKWNKSGRKLFSSAVGTPVTAPAN